LVEAQEKLYRVLTSEETWGPRPARLFEYRFGEHVATESAMELAKLLWSLSPGYGIRFRAKVGEAGEIGPETKVLWYLPEGVEEAEGEVAKSWGEEGKVRYVVLLPSQAYRWRKRMVRGPLPAKTPPGAEVREKYGGEYCVVEWKEPVWFLRVQKTSIPYTAARWVVEVLVPGTITVGPVPVSHLTL
jgi:hypothetical protein